MPEQNSIGPWKKLLCFKHIKETQEACGPEYQNALDKLSQQSEWCQKAWFYCVTNGNPLPSQALPKDQCPTEEQCKQIKKANSPVGASMYFCPEVQPSAIPAAAASCLVKAAELFRCVAK